MSPVGVTRQQLGDSQLLRSADCTIRRSHMAPRSNPSERQRRLGAELRKLRMRAGLSGEQAAAFLDADRARISNIEAGRIDVSRNRLYKVLREYDCPPGPYFDGLM